MKVRWVRTGQKGFLIHVRASYGFLLGSGRRLVRGANSAPRRRFLAPLKGQANFQSTYEQWRRSLYEACFSAASSTFLILLPLLRKCRQNRLSKKRAKTIRSSIRKRKSRSVFRLHPYFIGNAISVRNACFFRSSYWSASMATATA